MIARVSSQLLSRGGTYVSTGSGPVQIGIPAETIKDCLGKGLDVPQTYVLPHALFDARRGRSMAEFEFPAYYNYFILKRRVRLVVESAAVAARARQVFQESLFGPKDAPAGCEFDPSVPQDARPDFAKESDYFRRVPGRKPLELDELIDVVVMDPDAKFGSVRIASSDGAFHVWDDGNLAASVPYGAENLRSRLSIAPPSLSFEAPEFGVTVLGASHGFDPSGKTTGFLVWIGGRALLVDPPVDTTEYLRDKGVPPKLIDGLILTHCHADHDAGTFQKLLEEGRITLFTTPHILGSFLRKYSALSLRSEDDLRRLFDFHPVSIGSPVHLRGGELRFKYRLHSIPTIGVEAYYGGKSISISADTLYDPERIEAMFQEGVFGEARRDELITFETDHTLNFHEAGVPPIHTPTAALIALPEAVRARVRVVHIAERDVPPELVAAKVGLENTHVLDVQPPQFHDAIARLETLSMVDFLRELPLSRARALLSVATSMHFREGETIVRKGSTGDLFYVVERGVVAIVAGDRTLRRSTMGDFFGEAALVLNQARSADVVAESDVDLIVIRRDALFSLLRGTTMLERLKRLAQARVDGAWAVLDCNQALRRLSSAQKTQFESLVDRKELQVGEVLAARGEPAQGAYLLDGATALLEGLDDKAFVRGAFLAEVDAILGQKPVAQGVRVVQAGSAFFMPAERLRAFLGENPGTEIVFVGTRFVL
jgi:CRP-like cAMP-binding protein/phosphoribosyl 1,2-cyclic phosphodiesterase